MIFKSLGMSMVVAGIIHTGLGISEVSTYSHEVSLIGFASLLLGALVYLGGAIDQHLAERGNTRTRE